MAARTLWRDKLCEDRSRRELCPNFSAEFRRPSRAFSVERREMLYTVAERCEGQWTCGRGVRWSVRCCPIATTDRLTAGADVVEHDIYGGGWKNDDLRFVRQLALEDLQTATKSAR